MRKNRAGRLRSLPLAGFVRSLATRILYAKRAVTTSLQTRLCRCARTYASLCRCARAQASCCETRKRRQIHLLLFLFLVALVMFVCDGAFFVVPAANFCFCHAPSTARQKA